MKRIVAIALLCVPMALAIGSEAKEVPNDVQQALIALDKEWGQTAGDTAKLDKIIGDHVLAIGPKGEAQDKKELVAANASGAAGVTNAQLRRGGDDASRHHQGYEGWQGSHRVAPQSACFPEERWKVASGCQRAVADRIGSHRWVTSSLEIPRGPASWNPTLAQRTR
jgi:hypothetical protein